MNKQELIGSVAETTGMQRTEAGKAVEAVFDAMTNALKKGDEVRLVGFGTFTADAAQGEPGAQSQNRRADGHQGDRPAQVQGG